MSKKNFDEFEKALLDGESVFTGDGFMVVDFYAACHNSISGLISVSVQISIPVNNCGINYHRSSTICSSIEAYGVYSSFFEKYSKA